MVTIVAGMATEITVATSPLLVGDERVTVTLSVAAGESLEGVDSGVDRGQHAGSDFGDELKHPGQL